MPVVIRDNYCDAMQYNAGNYLVSTNIEGATCKLYVIQRKKLLYDNYYSWQLHLR